MSSSTRDPSSGRDRYHHGALREALVAAADGILAEAGPEGFTLREAARRAGVSPAAPSHHFGSASGLLTEVATRGFGELRRYLRESGASVEPRRRLEGLAIGYLHFALDHPARFQLMFRRGMLHSADVPLRAATRAAHGELEQAMRVYLELPPDAAFDEAGEAAILGIWSLAHGFACLALDGKFDGPSGEAPRRATLERMLLGVLAGMMPVR